MSINWELGSRNTHNLLIKCKNIFFMFDHMIKHSILNEQKHISPFRRVLIYIGAYLYGSLPLVYFLGHRSGIDLKQSGSGNVGAANLLANVGIKPATIGFLFDVSKGYLPILACRQLGYPKKVAEFAGVCGVIGQCWPIFLRFNGGRGLSPFIGASFLINRRSWVISLLPMIGGSLWHILSSVTCAPVNWLKGTRSKSTPFGCFLGILAFPILGYLDQNQGRKPQFAPILLSLIILGRRLTAPLSDDPANGPMRNKKALLYRLIYDRNTSC